MTVGTHRNATPTGWRLVYRQSVWTRLTHWIWVLSLFFLLTSGLQIFSAHPALYIGEQSGFHFDNSVLRIGAARDEGLVGLTEVFGKRFETTGVLGVSSGQPRAIPAWATTPSYLSLETGRIIHFFFALVLVASLSVWLAASLLDGHLRRDFFPSRADLRELPKLCWKYVCLQFDHRPRYNALQKLSYGIVIFALLPFMILTGLAMSPAVNAMIPTLTQLLGGRETARTLHFVVMLLLAGFTIVHLLMVLFVGPLNAMRSMITGWCRTESPPSETTEV